jgi:hypothetical protein
MRRKHISFKTKLAAALCNMHRLNDDGVWEKIIPYTKAKRLTEDQVIKLFEWDHYPILKAHGGVDAHYNLEPIPKEVHREKTSTIDIPQIAKTKRLANPKRSTTNWPSRKIESRGF